MGARAPCPGNDVRDRAGGAHRPEPAAPLRRGVLARARARGRLAATVAGTPARLSPARSARRNPGRPVRCRFPGEHFALPEAVGMLREVRRKQNSGAWVSLSGADPLNLAGVLTPGPKLAALTGNRVLYRDGVPVALYGGGEVQYVAELDAASQWEARNTLLRRAVPRSLVHLSRAVLAWVQGGLPKRGRVAKDGSEFGVKRLPPRAWRADAVSPSRRGSRARSPRAHPLRTRITKTRRKRSPTSHRGCRPPRNHRARPH